MVIQHGPAPGLVGQGGKITAGGSRGGHNRVIASIANVNGLSLMYGATAS
jgi:hypothetical protein